ILSDGPRRAEGRPRRAGHQPEIAGAAAEHPRWAARVRDLDVAGGREREADPGQAHVLLGRRDAGREAGRRRFREADLVVADLGGTVHGLTGPGRVLDGEPRKPDLTRGAHGENRLVAGLAPGVRRGPAR